MGIPNPDLECAFVDAENDNIKFTAEVQGGRARVSLFHNNNFFIFVKNLIFVRPERKLYVNDHAATIVVKEEEQEMLVTKLQSLCTVGKISFASEDSYDSATALAKLRQKQAEEMEEELEGLSPEMAAKAKAAALKKATTKKKVPKQHLDKLIEMGIPEVRAIRAFTYCDGNSVDAALKYLEKAVNDPSIDNPVDESISPEFTLPLTEEEKEKKAKELQEMIQKKKRQQEEEEQKRQIQLELKRRENQRSAVEIKEEYEKKKMQDLMRQRKLEKEADLKAKAAIRAKIAEDRAAKGWSEISHDDEKKSEEPSSSTTKNEQKINASEFFNSQKNAQSTTADNDDWNPFCKTDLPPPSPTFVPYPNVATLPVPGITLSDSALEEAVKKVVSLPESVKTLKLCLGNIIGEPFNIKFRSIKTTSSVAKNTILTVEPVVYLLFLIGFRNAGEKLAMVSCHLPTLQKVLTLLP